ncbi:putative AB hydrolase-1 domain-containing protein [Seiridium unicorne]|uniref:AB hydrolase-1 domain-containing protein n=1 Tax=Seiridium unicorne TaxID=138068 RepID=A0ABR2VE84_9PEZI
MSHSHSISRSEDFSQPYCSELGNIPASVCQIARTGERSSSNPFETRSLKHGYQFLPQLPVAVLDVTQWSALSLAGGDIGILYAKPSSRALKTPVVFSHGRLGSAWVWTPYMKYFREHGVTSYVFSTRGHGESWHLLLLRMVYATDKRMLGDDLVAGIKAVEMRESSEVVVFGHSSGGGLSQFTINEGSIKVKGLGLLGAMPGTGCFNPWFTFRLIFHGCHFNSLLSHPFLTKQALFSPEYPEPEIVEFQRHFNRYERFLWPLGMMLPFINAKQLLSNILD